MMPSSSPSVTQGRVWLVLAAVLWSLSGLFTRLLQKETIFGLHQPSLEPLQIAFYRALFAGLFFVPALRFGEMTFRPLMVGMVMAFAAMNAFFLSAMALGPAANAILLQNTAPFFVYLFCIFVLREPADRRSGEALAIGMVGVVVIIGAGWWREGIDRLEITAMALASGLLYGVVILCLRKMRDESSQWLTAQNHLGSAFCIGLGVLLFHGASYWWNWVTTPSVRQLAFLAFFGIVQMALPYWFFARGLKSVNPQEAGTITLLEPLLNPVWAYLVSPETETPPWATVLGGGLIIGALGWRYAPRRSR